MADPAASDDELVAAAGRGDEAAFNRLVRRHGDRVHHLAARMLGAAEAEDVTQEVFWRAWRAAPNWQPGGARFSTWLHRVTVNLCIDRERRAKLSRWLPLGAGPEPEADIAAPDVEVAAGEELRMVMRDIAGLPARQRAALLLSAEGERSNAEIGAVLGVSEKAVESLLVRARRTLRTQLAARGAED